jgi:hypothetical protein
VARGDVPVTTLHDPPLDGSVVVVLVEVTVSVALPLTAPLVATMFVVPAATAVIKPAAVTVAIDGEALVHDTLCPVNTLPVASFNTALARVVSPTAIEVRVSETEALATVPEV